MTAFLLGSRSRRAAAFGLLCACATLAQATRASAQQAVMMGDGSGGTFVSDDGSCPNGCEGGPACSYGYGDYQCYGNADGCSSCDGCNQCDSGCCESHCDGWFTAEYLAWKLTGTDLPPLLTSTPTALTPPNGVVQGSLSDPNVSIISGGDRVNDGWRSGYRLNTGFWLDCCHTCGFGVDWFQLGDDDYNYTSPQNSGIITARPFFNTTTAANDAQLVSVPNQLSGTATVHSGDDFEGAGATFNKSLWRCCDCCNSANLSMIGGYRFYRFDSDLSVTENLTVLPGTTTPLVPGTTFLVQDMFHTRNDFNGGEIGLQAYKQRKCFWVDGMAKIAIGQNVRTVTINGQTITDVPGGGVATAAGGLLTSSVTNIGQYRDTDFVVIPEFKAGIGACLTKCCSVHAGYDCIIWSDVARAAGALPTNLAVDPNNLPPVQAGGGAAPAFPGIHGTQLVAHGIDANIQFQW